MASWKKVLVSGSTVDVAGLQIGSTAVNSTAAELNLVDGSSAGTIVNSKAVIYGSSGEVNATTLQIGGTSITSTAAELNLMDGGTSATSTTVASGDRVVYNDNGTMKQVDVDDLDTYFSQTSKTLTNKTIAASQVTEISNLTAGEGAQLENIGSTTISATQWGYLGAFNQGLTTTSTVVFATISGSNISGSFQGDGSALTGVAAGSLDIDNFSALGSAGLAQGDHFLFSDGGTEKKITFSNLEDSIFGNISGDATVAAGGALTIANDAVGADQLDSNAVVNDSVASNAAIAFSKLAALTSGRILVGNSSNVATGVAMSGDVTISNTGATTIGEGTVDNAMLAGSIEDSKLNQIATANKVSLAALDIDGATALGAAPAGADLIPIDDGAGGTNKSMTVSNLETYMQNNLTFTTNTDVDVSVANLKTRLASNLGDVSFGDANDNITILGNLTVQGTKTELQTANLNVEDQFILLDSGSAGGTDTGIIFGGSSDTENSGYALGWDDSAGVFGISAEIASNATSIGTLSGKLGYIETSTSNPSSAPTRQGVGSIHVKTDDETIWIYA